MQKKRKIIVTLAICMGLALAATQVSNNGGLQSSTLTASLQSCKSGAITSLERCSTPLTTEKTRVQREVDTLTQDMAKKKTECDTLTKQKKAKSLITACTKQFTSLEKNSTTKKKELTALTLSLSKLVSEVPLKAKVESVQREIDTVKAQIVTKTAECKTLKSQKKTAQATTCNTQLTTLKQTETTKKKELTAATSALKKVAGASALLAIPAPTPTTNPTPAPSPTPVATLVTTPTTPAPTLTPAQSAPVLVTSVTPVASNDCCFEISASNYDPACIAPRNPNPASCIMQPATTANILSICTEPTASNFMQTGDCMQNGFDVHTTGCTSMGAINYNYAARVDDGSCSYPVPGCLDTSAHNYAPSSSYADNSCMTCHDSIRNGDEMGVDCGGRKCDTCPEPLPISPITLILCTDFDEENLGGEDSPQKSEGDFYNRNFVGNWTDQAEVGAELYHESLEASQVEYREYKGSGDRNDINNYSDLIIEKDTCQDAYSLREYYCAFDLSLLHEAGGEQGINCKYGCANGACLTQSQSTPPTRDDLINGSFDELFPTASAGQ